MSDTNTTETVASEETAITPSAPIQSPSAPTSGSGKAPSAQSPTFPATSPVSAPTAKGTFPVSSPASAPSAPVFESPVSAPESFPSRLTDPRVPTTFGGDKTAPASPTSMTQEVEAFVLNPFHLILIAGIAGVVTLLLFWKCCKSWKLRREKQMLRLQSTRVDAVLGDMQMVGMDDYDGDDPELI